MQNIRSKLCNNLQGYRKRTVVCVIGIVLAAIILGLINTGNIPDAKGADKEQNLLTVAEEIRMGGDILTASVNPNKVTGSSSSLATSLRNVSGQSLKVSEFAKEMSVSYLGRENRWEQNKQTLDKEEIPAQKELKQELEEAEDESQPEERRSLGSFDDSIRREKKIFEEEIIIERPIEEKMTSLLKPGQRKVIQAGTDGRKTVTYQQEFVNGEPRKKKILSEEIHQEPVKEVVMVGVSGYQGAISPLDFSVELDESGVPTNYSKVLTNQTATGYNVGRGAWGASGQRLSAGYVAVHPGEIPYGTKMYITSPDNSFVYGFAIAADTGIGLLGDVIDVDLYYDTYLESCLNGKRNVNIYILD